MRVSLYIFYLPRKENCTFVPALSSKLAREELLDHVLRNHRKRQEQLTGVCRTHFQSEPNLELVPRELVGEGVGDIMPVKVTLPKYFQVLSAIKGQAWESRAIKVSAKSEASGFIAVNSMGRINGV